MGSLKLKSLQLPQNLVAILEKHDILTCKDVLCLTKLDLQSILGISHLKLENLLCEVSKKCTPDPKSVLTMFMEGTSTANRFLALSLHAVDLLLNGGIPFGTITELAGPPGVGKTQFCFMLSILATVAAPHGLGSQVLYIDTESSFSAERLKNMTERRFPQLTKLRDGVTDALRNIFVQKANSVQKLKEIISHLEVALIRKNIKLVIVDSIASLMRKEFGADGLESVLERNKTLIELTALLKDLAKSYDFAVFLTNQITTSQSPDACTSNENECLVDVDGEILTDCPDETAEISAQLSNMRSADHVIPALGNTWAHCVNTRLVAHFMDSHVRQLVVVKSPTAPNAAVRYVIDESGIRLTDDDIEFVNIRNFEQLGIVTKNTFLTFNDIPYH